MLAPSAASVSNLFEARTAGKEASALSLFCPRRSIAKFRLFREQRASGKKPKQIVAQVPNLHPCPPQHLRIARYVQEIEEDEAEQSDRVAS